MMFVTLLLYSKLLSLSPCDPLENTMELDTEELGQNVFIY